MIVEAIKLIRVTTNYLKKVGPKLNSEETHNSYIYAAQELFNRGFQLMEHFKRTGNLPDISEAISIQQWAIQLTSDGHPEMPGRLNNLGISLQSRFKHTGDISDLSEAISNQQQAVQLAPDSHPDMPMWLSDLGISFQNRFKRTGDISDLSEAILIQQRAVQLTPNGHPDMRMWLNNLGISFRSRFERTGDVSDLTEAISNQQWAVQLTPAGHPHMPILLNNLGNSFQSRFERTDDVSDLSEAISIRQQAIQLTPDGHPHMLMRLNNLGILFQSRFERTGDFSDVTAAIFNKQRVVQLTPDGHLDMPMWLNNLGISFRSRFERTGNVSDLMEAISIQQRAVQLTPDGHPDMPMWLNNLGNSFQNRFERTGDISDLSEAISIRQQAVQLTPDGHPHMSMRLNNLGISFQSRFERTGDVSDLSEAISNKQQAVQLTPDGHPYMPMWFDNLGISLQSRFERTGDVSDLSEAISNKQRAVHLTPNGHPDMLMRLNNLGISFRSRFERTGDISDLTEAISNQQRAVQLTSDGHPDMPMWLNNLGISFESRFERTGDISDLSEAISNKQRAVQLVPDGHPGMPMWLYNLGHSFQSRFECTGDVSDIHTAILTFRKCATTYGHSFARLRAAQRWAQLSMALGLPYPLTAYGVAINLVSKVAGMDRTIEQRLKYLVDVSSLISSAASAAFTLADIEKALEWLEQGRCLVWSQLKQLRTPLDHLRTYDDQLAQRFLDISSALEVSGSRRRSEGLDTNTTLSEKISLQEEAHLHIKLSREWRELLDKIRHIPHFHDFLQPPQTSDLLKHLPREGIVILVNVHKDRCDALALISSVSAPKHIPLDLTYDEASELTKRLSLFLSSHGVRMREADRGGRPARRPDAEKRSDIHFILEALWLRVVRPILDGLAFPVSVAQFMRCHFIDIFSKSAPLSDPTRIWWCPTGSLAFLPLHAMGMYSQNGGTPPGSCISDFAISSYAPTVSSLVQKLEEYTHVQEAASSKLLIISQPNTPDCSLIPQTTKEVNCILKAIGTSNEESLCLEGASALVNRVKLEMESHGLIHLACHASQSLEDPLKSSFYLPDGRLELSEIMKQKFAIRELAFLSACQTSTGDEKLSDEVVHLAAGMLAAGYQSVVATMWSIMDQYGPVVAESFYKDLMERGQTSGQSRLVSSHAAHALHHAIQGIRETVGDTEQGLLTWVPYVHFGH